MITKNTFLISAFFLLVQACGPTVEKPFLSDEITIRVMADMYLAEAATNGLSGYQRDSLMHVFFDQIFEIHDISKEDYEKNLRILATDELHLNAVVEAAVELVEGPKEEETGVK